MIRLTQIGNRVSGTHTEHGSGTLDATVPGRVRQGVWGTRDGRRGTIRRELTADALGCTGTVETTGFAGNLNATRD